MKRYFKESAEKPKIVLIRGLPGSGKSTLAKEYKKQGYKHIESDMYPGLYDKDSRGEYTLDEKGLPIFHPELLGKAHKWCQDVAEKNLSAGKNVVVSNTFTQLWEIKPYILIAKKLGIPFENIVIKEGKFKGQNIHGVPEEGLAKMKARWETMDKDVRNIDWDSIKSPF